MPFNCYLCQEETVITSFFCSDCNYIKRILQCYGRTEIKDIITKVCIRNDKQMNNKIEIIKEKFDKEEKKQIKKEKEIEKQSVGDSSYIKPNNLNKDYIDELKNKIKDY